MLSVCVCIVLLFLTFNIGYICYTNGQEVQKIVNDNLLDNIYKETRNKIEENERKFKIEAVSRGYATWEVSRYGSLEFKWNQK